MNDFNLKDVIEESVDHVDVRDGNGNGDARNESENGIPRLRPRVHSKHTHTGTQSHLQHRHQRERKEKEKEDEEDDSIYQPTQYWFAATAFPLFAGTFGPIANLFSVCALVQTWRVGVFDGSRVGDPPWLIALNATSLVFALLANFVLLLNFARRIPYGVAQPITITFWYIASLLLLIPLCLIRSPPARVPFPFPQTEYSQAYYYALISCILYTLVSTLLLLSTLLATSLHIYPPSFSTLSAPQRTLMLQTIAFTLYLSLGAGVFSHIEGWGFADGVYWADYTLLTIGLGTDFPLTTTAARMLLIPYAAVGVMVVGLVVASVRGLVLERAKAKVVRRRMGRERERWRESVEERRRAIAAAEEKEVGVSQSQSQSQTPSQPRSWLKKRKNKNLPEPLSLKTREKLGPWHRAEFELMRHLEKNAETTERYAALSVSFVVMLVVWCGGAVVFWVCEHKTQQWTFPESIYFTYTTLLTIGYGDFYPNSPAGKPFFVVWSLISVPAMTVLISNMGETVVRWVRDGTGWVGAWTVLPERVSERLDLERKREGEGDGFGRKKKRSMRRRKRRKRGDSDRGDVEEDEGEDEHHQQDSTTLHRDIEFLSTQTHIDQYEVDVEIGEDDGRGGRGARGNLSPAPALAPRIAREITLLARDLRVAPGRKYAWEEWVGWLDMLGHGERGGSERAGRGERGGAEVGQHENGHGQTETHIRASAPVILNSSLAPHDSDINRTKDDVTISALPSPSHSHSPSPNTNTDNNTNPSPNPSPSPNTNLSPNPNTANNTETNDWNWTWLSDHGPLFSQRTETEWILERLCVRLEEVMGMGVEVGDGDEAREEGGAGEGGAGEGRGDVTRTF